ncbi:hypothetical protein PIB30_093220 [Stylosanthes scabra]|uniref:Uncharacterized protein n=1 Tax=Stylosanthes scabra TaxID=79078 RepID=A0ABU6SVF9_9FABA|nr:hypothetical protein [Stylosanthes scabra]
MARRKSRASIELGVQAHSHTQNPFTLSLRLHNPITLSLPTLRRAPCLSHVHRRCRLLPSASCLSITTLASISSRRASLFHYYATAAAFAPSRLVVRAATLLRRLRVAFSH